MRRWRGTDILFHKSFRRVRKSAVRILFSRRMEKRGRGFTLLELLLGISILIILVMLLGQILTHATGAWTMGESNKERMQNERAISDFIANELRAALLPVNRTDKSNLQFVVTSGSNPMLSSIFQNRDAVFWQAPLASDQTLGDVAEIGYFVKWDTSVPSNPRSLLCRFFVNSGNNGSPDPNYMIYSGTTGWLTDTIVKSVAPADKANAYQGLFAENVMGLWVQCLDSRGQPITKDYNGNTLTSFSYDSRLGYTDSTGAKSSGYTDSSSTLQPLCALPPSVRLSFVLLDSRLASRIDPALQASITALANSSADANAFTSSSLTDPTFKAIRSGLRPYQTTIYLQGSK